LQGRLGKHTTCEKIRALSIGQPWAELILSHRKPIEIRTWKCSYRGPLLIHASGKWNAAAAADLGIAKESVTRGAFVAVANLADIRPFTRADARFLKNKRGGDSWWEPNHYAWALKSVTRIKPIPFKGQLNLFPVPASVMRRIVRELKNLDAKGRVRG
jgi:hypothetical protein